MNERKWHSPFLSVFMWHITMCPRWIMIPFLKIYMYFSVMTHKIDHVFLLINYPKVEIPPKMFLKQLNPYATFEVIHHQSETTSFFYVNFPKHTHKNFSCIAYCTLQYSYLHYSAYRHSNVRWTAQVKTWPYDDCSVKKEHNQAYSRTRPIRKTF